MSDDWELVKENTMPLKRGRHDVAKRKPLGGFGEIVGKKDRLAKEMEIWEDKLVDAKSSGPMEDPLSVWIKYIKWIQDNYEAGCNELMSVVERCTREFKDDERYRDNEKYLRVWILYADMLDNPTTVFKFLRQNGLFDGLSLYYIATAWTAERRGDFPLADKAYVVGLEKKAQPLELLQKRHREFQRRMSRRWLNQAEEQQQTQEEDQQEETMLDENGRRVPQPQRTTLQPLTKREATSMHRPVNTNRKQRGLQLRNATSTSNENKSNVNSASSFAVFDENSAPSIAQRPLGRRDDWGNGKDENNTWKVLGTAKEQQKENSLNAGPWTNQALGRMAARPNSGSVAPADPASSTTTPGRPQFAIFVEPGSSSGSTMDDSVSVSGMSTASASGLTLKERSEKSESENLMKKPLQNFDTEKPTTKAKKTSTQQLQQYDQDDVTINTRMALDDMFEMFGSPSMKETGAKFSSPLLEEDEEEGRFRDDLSSSDEEAGPPSSSSSSLSAAPRAPFAIFQDTSNNNNDSSRSNDDDENAVYDEDQENKDATGRLMRTLSETSEIDESRVFAPVNMAKFSERFDDLEVEEPEGFRAEPNVDSNELDKPFQIFQDQASPSSNDNNDGFDDQNDDDLDHTFTFAPLESIMEASGEVDESMMSN